MPTNCDLNNIIIGVTITVISAIILWVAKTSCNIKDSKKIYNWLKDNTKDEPGNSAKSTYDIANWNNLTEERVHQLCSKDKRIFPSSRNKKDVWNIYKRNNNKPRYYFG